MRTMRIIPRKRRRTASVTVLTVLLLVAAQSGMVESVATARNLLDLPTTSVPSPRDVGRGDSVVAQAPAGRTIDAVRGSFERTVQENMPPTPTPNVTDVRTGGLLDAYTLQINTEHFRTDACNGGLIGCRGWLQFVFANDPTSPDCRPDRVDCGRLYIRYWLVSYSNDGSCPQLGGWLPDPNVFGSCFQESQDGPTDGPIPYMPFTDATMLAYRLTANIEDNTITFFDGHRNYDRDGINVFSAMPQVTSVEFNVFGADLGSGSRVDFNPDADFYARILLTYPDGSMAEPVCATRTVGGTPGFSSESNNLYFSTKPPLKTPPAPAVLFHQKMIPDINLEPPNTACAAALTIGDTHERTFAGLTYDFQATGDFVEAQIGTTFEVQTRKGPGIPGYPNTSMNKSVAARMGATQVAMCDGTGLMVDRRSIDLASGASLSLPTGVTIHRDGDTYRAKDPSGNSISVTVHDNAIPRYVDLEVGLGSWPVTVRGLLGNPGNDPNRLEARNGRTFTWPLSFNDLYGVFGPSWRVAPVSSLLTSCPSGPSGIPSAPFFATNIEPQLRLTAESFCREAGINTNVWVQACTLDVVVLGMRARDAFVDQPPVIDGNTYPPPR